MYSSIKVLIVDENEESAETLGELLEMWGYEVKTAYDGFAALERVKDFIPDIIMIDIGLSRMNGFQLAEELRRDFRFAGSILVAVTGCAAPSHKKRAIDSGFNHFIA